MKEILKRSLYEEVESKLLFTAPPRKVHLLNHYLKSGQLDTLSDRSFWALVRDTWIETEFPSDNVCLWKNIFSSRRQDKWSIRNLPDELVIYRGGTSDGLSWTTSIETASWFANRNLLFGEFEEDCIVWKAKIKRDSIVFFSNARDENEVVLFDAPERSFGIAPNNDEK